MFIWLGKRRTRAIRCASRRVRSTAAVSSSRFADAIRGLASTHSPLDMWSAIMPKATDYEASAVKKLLYIGDSGGGKTTSLFSLLKAGYKLRIYDYDQLLAPLVTYTK